MSAPTSIDSPMPIHLCNGSCDCDSDTLHHHSVPTLIRLADLYLGDVRLLVSHVIDLFERLSQLDPAHRGVRTMFAAAHQISAITAERQLKLGELADEVVRRTALLHPPMTIPPAPPQPPAQSGLAPATAASGPDTRTPSPLLALPGEIRNLIYHFCLAPPRDGQTGCPELHPYAPAPIRPGNVTPALLAANRQIYAEATPILYGASTVVLDPFMVPRFMFQIAGSSRWLRRVRLVELAELKVLGVGRVRADELKDGCGRGGRGVRRVGCRGEEGGKECWSDGETDEGAGEGGFWDCARRREPLRLQLYLLHRATNLERLDVVWCGGADDDALPVGVARPPGSAEAAARDVFGLLYPWLAAVAEARGERRAAARIVWPFTHLGDRGAGLDRAAFRKKLGTLLEKGVQLEDEADEGVSME